MSAMEMISFAGLTLFFDADEREAAELIGQACEKSVDLIQERWGLPLPEDLRVYVMKSWLRFAFRSAPWHWWPVMVVSLPLWGSRARQVWRYAGGWAQRYGKRRTVGVKPPDLIQLGDRGIGARIFVEEADVREKVQNVTCHELVHAFTDHLKLPTWLHEGLAMVTVDMYGGKPTVRGETVEILGRWSDKAEAGADQKMRVADQDAAVYLYVRGYWLTRYLEDTRPGLLKGLLTQRYSHQELEEKVASAYEVAPDEFWGDIDRAAASHFKQTETVAGRR